MSLFQTPLRRLWNALPLALREREVTPEAETAGP
jgi:hypothetical protein